MTFAEIPYEQPFVRWADWYDDLYVARSRDPAREVELRKHEFEWIKQETKAKHLRILDVGCGTGVHWPFLCKYGDVTGIDRCPEMLAVAKARYPQGDWRLGDIRDMSTAEKFHAAVMLFGVVAYAQSNDEAQSLLRCAASHLEPEGLLSVGIEFTCESLRPPEARVVRVERDGEVLVRESNAVIRTSRDGSEHLVTTFTFSNGDGNALWREEHQHLIAPYETWKDWLYAAVNREGLSWQLTIRQSRITKE
jgi:trans-aconitate methyltransferase